MNPFCPTVRASPDVFFFFFCENVSLDVWEDHTTNTSQLKNSHCHMRFFFSFFSVQRKTCEQHQWRIRNEESFLNIFWRLCVPDFNYFRNFWKLSAFFSVASNLGDYKLLWCKVLQGVQSKLLRWSKQDPEFGQQGEPNPWPKPELGQQFMFFHSFVFLLDFCQSPSLKNHYWTAFSNYWSLIARKYIRTFALLQVVLLHNLQWQMDGARTPPPPIQDLFLQ